MLVQRGEAKVGTDKECLLPGSRHGLGDPDCSRRLSFLLERARDDDDLATALMRVLERRLKRLVGLLGNRTCGHLRTPESLPRERDPCQYGQVRQLRELSRLGDSRPDEIAAERDENGEERCSEEGDEAVADRARRVGAGGHRRRLCEPKIGTDARLGDYQFADAIADCLKLLWRCAGGAQTRQQ